MTPILHYLQIIILVLLLYCFCRYFFVGYQSDPSKFFLFFFVLTIFQLISESIGLICSVLTSHLTYAVITLTFLLLVLLSFSGFLLARIPVYFVWINRVSYLTYAYAALMDSQLDGLMVMDPSNPEGSWIQANTLTKISNGLSMQENVGVLVAIWAGVEAIKLGGFHLANRLGLI